MSVAYLLQNPFGSPRDWDEWSFHHRNDHLEILQAVQKQLGVQLTDYDIYPISEKGMQNFLLNHQSMHNAFNGYLGYEGSDLNQVDFNDEKQRSFWLYENFNEHYAARNKLGI